MAKSPPSSKAELKLEKLFYKSYLQMIEDSVGSHMFRHFWAKSRSRPGQIDVLSEGYNSCAYYVSALVKIFGKIDTFHTTVDATVHDLTQSGWLDTKEPRPGDIVVWEALKFDDGWHKHIGFYLGKNRAISNSWTKKVPLEHDLHFGPTSRAVEQYLTTKW